MQQEVLCVAFESIVGKQNCITDPEIIKTYLEDWRGIHVGFTPIVLLPNSTQSIAQIMKICFDNDIGVTPQGGNTSLCGANIPHSTKDRLEIVINSSKMNQILELDTHNQSLIVQSGCILSTIQAIAEDKGLFFPLSMGAEGSCQIGGNISTNAGGVNVLKYGMVREQIMGLEVVLPDGTIFSDLKGLRKDNTGYDLKQLFIGAEGTLGFITAVCLKLFSQPMSYSSALVAVENPFMALELLKKGKAFFGENLTGFELMSSSCIQAVEKYLPSCKIPLSSLYPWHILIEVGNITTDQNNDERMVVFLEKALADTLITDGIVANSMQERKDFWRIRHAIPEAEKYTGPAIYHDISVPISKIPELIEQSIAELEQYIGKSTVFAFGHVGDGNLHFTKGKPASMDKTQFLNETANVHRIVHEVAVQLGGSFSAEHGIGTKLKNELEHFSDPVKLELLRTIKNSIDPKNIMNPHKLIG